MLRKYSIFMMLLLATGSLVGISSMYQPAKIEAQPQAQQPLQQGQTIIKNVIGKVDTVHVYSSSDGKACLAEVVVVVPNNLRHRPGVEIELLSPDESICTLFGQSKIGKTQIMFRVEKLTTLDALPPTLRQHYPEGPPTLLYRVHDIRMY